MEENASVDGIFVADEDVTDHIQNVSMIQSMLQSDGCPASLPWWNAVRIFRTAW